MGDHPEGATQLRPGLLLAAERGLSTRAAESGVAWTDRRRRWQSHGVVGLKRNQDESVDGARSRTTGLRLALATPTFSEAH